VHAAAWASPDIFQTALAQATQIDRATAAQPAGSPVVPLEQTGQPLLFAAIGVIGVLSFLFMRLYLNHRSLKQSLDNTKLQLNQKQHALNELASVDQLTGTSNRKAITTFLSEFHKQPHADGEFIALAILDIDYFQRINDALGYFAGDAVLKEVASRIEGELRDEDRVGRMNANHFAIVLCDLIAPKTAENIIHRIQSVIAQPIIFNDTDINVTCSVGAAVQEVETLDIAELFKLSEQALLQAKRNQRGSIFLFSEHAQYALSRQRQIINLLRERDFDDLFQLAYQPIVAISDRSVVGCECLLRWIADSPADLDTAELMPILEMYGDIHAVGDWVLSRSFAQLAAWHQRLDCPGLFVSINVSAIQLEASDFAEKIVSLADEHAVSPRDVSLELTETVAIKHLEAGRKHLALLRNLGFGVSLDDFGTGYSSLQYLKSMPASTIKIDQTFVREMNADKRDAAIVCSAINIAKALGLNVVAEGIDNEEQHRQLQHAGCDYGQGFYYAKPLDSGAFEQLIAAGPRQRLSG
jgi:diguanylate cyclase (GGDEF)-like protein